MTPKKAAEIIGISPAQMRLACRKGLILATKVRLENGDPNAFVYNLLKRDVLYYKAHRPKRGPKGKVGSNGSRH